MKYEQHNIVKITDLGLGHVVVITDDGMRYCGCGVHWQGRGSE